MRAGDLRPHPRNWRTHPEAQRSALAAMLADVGWADALLVREKDGGLELVDGHLRAGLNPDDQVPVLVLDLSDDEAEKVLLTLDPLAGMAEVDQQRLSSLLDRLSLDGTALDGLGRMVRDLYLPPDGPPGAVVLPDLDASGPATRSFTVYLPPEQMAEVEAALGRMPGGSVSEKVLAMARLVP